MVSLSSLSFLRNLRTENKQFAIIGLGRFGRAVCLTLHGLGYEVLAVDTDETKVHQALKDQIASHAMELDTTDPNSLAEVGFSEFDVVIVAIGNYLAQSIITTLNLKELGVKQVVAKASSEIHMKLLTKVGADHVVFPEREMGYELARSLTKPRLLDQFELDPNHSIVEMLVPEQFHNKTIAQLELRNRFGINVLAVGQEDKFEINPLPTKRIEKGDVMVIIGSNKDIDRIPL